MVEDFGFDLVDEDKDVVLCYIWVSIVLMLMWR